MNLIHVSTFIIAYFTIGSFGSKFPHEYIQQKPRSPPIVREDFERDAATTIGQELLQQQREDGPRHGEAYEVPKPTPERIVAKTKPRAPQRKQKINQQKIEQQKTQPEVKQQPQEDPRLNAANHYGFAPSDHYAVFGSEGTGHGWFASLRSRHYDEAMHSVAAGLTTVMKEFVAAAPVTQLEGRTRAYYWAEYDNQMYWTSTSMCRVRVNSDVCQEWSPAMNRSVGLAEARERPSHDVTIALYFACDGSCCDTDCCRIDMWKIVWRIAHIWFIIMLVFWTSAGLHFLYITLRTAHVESKQKRQPMWPKSWLNARKSILRTRAVTDAAERKLLVENMEDPMDVHFQ